MKKETAEKLERRRKEKEKRILAKMRELGREVVVVESKIETVNDIIELLVEEREHILKSLVSIKKTIEKEKKSFFEL